MNITTSTNDAISAYPRQLRTTAFEMERWKAFSDMVPSEKAFYARQMSELVRDGQHIKRVFFEEFHGTTSQLHVHDRSAYVDLPLPQALYEAASTLNKVLIGVKPETLLGYAISGVQNVAEDVANTLGEELDTELPEPENDSLGIE